MSEPSDVVAAAKAMDWQQVVMNGGPPCFNLGDDGMFCGRAERWEGHKDKDCIHKFVPLHELIKSERLRGMEEAAKICDVIAAAQVVKDNPSEYETLDSEKCASSIRAAMGKEP